MRECEICDKNFVVVARSFVNSSYDTVSTCLFPLTFVFQTVSLASISCSIDGSNYA